MNRIGFLFKSATALLLTALLAGCGSGGDGRSLGQTPDPAGPPTAAGVGTGVGGLGRGPAPVPLGTAGAFTILSANELANIGPSVVTGNVGSTYAPGSQVELTCGEVLGTIYKRDRTGDSCMQRDLTLLTVAKADGDAAFNDSKDRVPDYTELGDGNIGGRNLGPATYKWTTPVQVATDLTLTGGPNDVWIFYMEQGLIVSADVRILLKGGALPQNVFWAPTFQVELGSGSQFKGILLPAATVLMGNGASLYGAILAEGVHLDHNIVSP
ncbi:MAG: DUF3494 domain-containing protein [Prolixibacteraceae bacterium]|nr:DUF3494 domain-containing protein [Burkholderiales bacterium]